MTIDWNAFTPWHAVAGGVAIGLATAIFVLFNGRIAGISGILGGYMMMFPRNRVRVLTQRGVMAVPAFVMLGLWILLQVFSGLGSLGARTGETGGVAFMAHVGGFVAGLVLVKLFAAGRGVAGVSGTPLRY